MLCETVIEDPRWDDAHLAELAERASQATLCHLGLAPADYEISLLGCDDARISELNQSFRGKTSATNVLSWPSAERGAVQDGGTPIPPDEDPELGDIAIAYETCLTEANAAPKPFADHVTHLIVHGVLHLLGYDHQRDKDAALMEGLESAILIELGLADPYMGLSSEPESEDG